MTLILAFMAGDRHVFACQNRLTMEYVCYSAAASIITWAGANARALDDLHACHWLSHAHFIRVCCSVDVHTAAIQCKCQTSTSLVRSRTSMAESSSVMRILEEAIHQSEYVIRQRGQGGVHGTRYNCN